MHVETKEGCARRSYGVWPRQTPSAWVQLIFYSATSSWPCIILNMREHIKSHPTLREPINHYLSRWSIIALVQFLLSRHHGLNWKRFFASIWPLKIASPLLLDFINRIKYWIRTSLLSNSGNCPFFISIQSASLVIGRVANMATESCDAHCYFRKKNQDGIDNEI